jgi:NAD(P)-dependent dehydrogenase (short-subunit alcohol dehydrogenase family)
MAQQSSPSRHPSLENRTILVSGGASGIGAEIVRGFVDQGSKVAFLDLDQVSGASLVASLGGAAHFEPCDLQDIEALRAAVISVEEALGPIDVLVNNAADDTRHDFDTVEPDYFDERIHANLRHYFFTAQAVREGMASRGGGAVVNLGSICWRIGFPDVPVYAMAKAAIVGMTRVLARECGPQRIRVNCVEPGYVVTPRQRDRWMTPELEEVVRRGQALPDFIEPAAVADMVMFVASDAARMCTGQTFVVDGGWT